MHDTILEQRRRWFRFFPEGGIEFAIVTRVLMVFLLLALGVVRDTQRPAALTVLLLVVWLDYALTLWWVVQMAVDLDDLRLDPTGSGEQARRRRIRLGFIVCLPSVAALIALAPWPGLLFKNPVMRDAAAGIVPLVCGIAYLALTSLAVRSLRKLRIGSTVWTVLLLVPVLHWPALHRVLGTLWERLRLLEQSRGQTVQPPSGALSAAADALWGLALLPWLVVIVLQVVRDRWPSMFLPTCGAILAGLFMIADLAAMERLQRHFVAALRRP